MKNPLASSRRARRRTLGAWVLAGALTMMIGTVTARAAEQDATNTYTTTINGNDINGNYAVDGGKPVFVVGFQLSPGLLANVLGLSCPGAQTQLSGGPGGSPECLFKTPVMSTTFTLSGKDPWPNIVPMTPFGSYDDATYAFFTPITISAPAAVPAVPQPQNPVTLPKQDPGTTPAIQPPAQGGAGGTGLAWLWGLFAGGGLLLGAGGLVTGRRREPAAQAPDTVEQPQLPPNEVFTPAQPAEPVSTGRTIEKPGTGNPDAVGMDPADRYRTVSGPDVWIDDSMARLLQRGIENQRFNEEMGPVPTIRVHYAEDTWFIPDPAFVNMAEGDKYSKAFHQMYDSGILGEEFKEALLALLEPDSIFLFISVVGIQFIPGVNVVVDAAALLLLLITFGTQLDDFITAMGKVKSAINQQQFDHAVKEVAKILAGVSTTVLVTFGLKAGKWAKGKLTNGTSGSGGGKPSETAPAGKNPALNTGGVHDALPAENGPAVKKPALNTGGVHDALPNNGNGGSSAAPKDLGTAPKLNTPVGNLVDPHTGEPIPWSKPPYSNPHPITDSPTWHGKSVTQEGTWKGAGAPPNGMAPKVNPLIGTLLDPVTGEPKPSPLYPQIGTEETPTWKGHPHTGAGDGGPTGTVKGRM